nr:hypothetical protein [Bacteroidales bacterium]
AGAAKTALAALKLAWLEGLFPLRKAWLELRTFLQDSWTISIHTILKMANNLWFEPFMPVWSAVFSSTPILISI